jgi:L-threonylcarbamoyladenylate synthase
VADSTNEAAVRRIYELKGRDDDKSPIVLISEISQIFDELIPEHKAYVTHAWPAPVSVIIPSRQAPTWIRRGNDSVAYRMPADDDLRRLIDQTGPLIAPSANPQGMQPAMNIREAKYYFGDNVDFYVDGGKVEDPRPSQIMKFESDGEVTRIR